MPRIRTLKPEHRQHRKVGPLDHITYRLWVGMILEADDEGRLVYDAAALRVLIFGYHVDVTRAIIEDSTSALAAIGLIRRYVVNGQNYVDFPSWHDHQKIDRPRPSLLPTYEASSKARRILDDHSSNIREESRGVDERSRGLVADRILDSKDSMRQQTPGSRTTRARARSNPKAKKNQEFACAKGIDARPANPPRPDFLDAVHRMTVKYPELTDPSGEGRADA